MQVVVTGMGLVSALGCLEQSWFHLLDHHSGISQHQPFPELRPRPLAFIGQTPINVGDLSQQVVNHALKDAGLAPPLPECGVTIGSSRSSQGLWEQLARQRRAKHQINQTPWLETLPHQIAIRAARQIGSTTAVLAPMAACATGIWAIFQGFELIQSGQCQRVIAGAVEAPITPLTLAGFDKVGALAKTGAYPFDKQRQGLVLGEGAAVVVLESAQLAQRRGAFIYGQILGFGLSCDAYHVSAPSPDRQSATVAIQDCLKRSHLYPEDIHYIHAHGTATQLNDYNEAQLIKQLFPHGVPVSSTKGATGHTLGASGAMGVVWSLMALKHQQLPPCIGLSQPEFDLDFVTSSRRAMVQQVLCFSFGFGGQNAVVALAGYPHF